ncbi:hypothetical protein [Nocardia sp. NPDC004604]|uniref:hypothetical protein n=1 Tax=Nocardia sp. NPDC004604 TaxID=3157013 RepID=UPI0033B9E97C
MKYEHLFRGVIADGDALDMEVHRFRVIYNTIRPHQAIDDQVASSAFTAASSGKPLDTRCRFWRWATPRPRRSRRSCPTTMVSPNPCHTGWGCRDVSSTPKTPVETRCHRGATDDRELVGVGRAIQPVAESSVLSGVPYACRLVGDDEPQCLDHDVTSFLGLGRARTGLVGYAAG